MSCCLGKPKKKIIEIATEPVVNKPKVKLSKEKKKFTK